MRTLLCEREGIPRAEAVRRAVTEFLRARRPSGESAFGLWAGRRTDGYMMVPRLMANVSTK